MSRDLTPLAYTRSADAEGEQVGNKIHQEDDDERRPLLQNSTSATSIRQSSNNRAKKLEATIGLGIVAFGALFFSFSSVLIKFCGATFPPFEILLARAIVQTVVGLASCFCFGIDPLVSRPLRPWLVLRGVVGCLAVAASNYAIAHLHFSDVSVLIYLNGAFTTLMAALVLGEPFRRFEGICVSFCLIGAILVSKPDFLFGTILHDHGGDNDNGGDGNSAKGLAILLAITSAFMSSITFCIIRKIGKAVHFLIYTVYYGAVTVVICIPALLTFQPFVWPQTTIEYTMLFTSGICAFIGQCFLSKGLQMTPAGPASLMSMNSLVLSFLYGVFLFGEYPDVLGVLGAIIIAVTTAALALRKK
ncbi:hypothetical protein BDA99DRAFT_553877 [Phascolomyces articulosus]|uniref:EamA domain-containing protein n=1 Tax=Phascolomyces articulosus TaxID=60185 RepID=A0AAD5KPI7_9FUNG|nr:hypothetical protein BDA99DRAFT_553877 [Phascolomyces articulosus]